MKSFQRRKFIQCVVTGLPILLAGCQETLNPKPATTTEKTSTFDHELNECVPGCRTTRQMSVVNKDDTKYVIQAELYSNGELLHSDTYNINVNETVEVKTFFQPHFASTANMTLVSSDGKTFGPNHNTDIQIDVCVEWNPIKIKDSNFKTEYTPIGCL